jgi:hypothetical protein
MHGRRIIYHSYKILSCRSQWPRGLRRGPAAYCLLELLVRIPPGAWMSVCCVFSEFSASGCSLVQRSPTDCGASQCDREAAIIRRPRPNGGCCPLVKKKCYIQGAGKVQSV